MRLNELIARTFGPLLEHLMKWYRLAYAISALAGIAAVMLFGVALSSGPDPFLVALLIAFWVMPCVAIAGVSFAIASGLRHRPEPEPARTRPMSGAGKIVAALGWIWLAVVIGHTVGFLSGAPSVGSLGVAGSVTAICLRGLPGIVLILVGNRMRRRSTDASGA